MSPENGRSSIEERLFKKASLTCPASIPGQAAVLALECKKRGLNPRDYQRKLTLKEKWRLDLAAHHAHKNLPEERRPEFDYSELEGIFKRVYRVAEEMMFLDENSLNEIIHVDYPNRLRFTDSDGDYIDQDFELDIRERYNIPKKDIDLS
jgi:hypothetical protein